MRHATEEDLERLEDVLAALGQMPELVERKPGYFDRRSRAFLHFHEDPSGLYADVKLSDHFERVRVETAEERRSFLRSVRAVLHSPEP